MSGATGLYDDAVALLAVVTGALTTTSGGTIARAYVSHGSPAFDCEQVTVHTGLLGDAATSPLGPALSQGFRRETQGAVELAGYVITIIRCYPVIDDSDPAAPSAATIEAVAAVTLEDLWVTWNTVKQAWRARTIFASDDGKYARELVFDGAVPISPSGGLAGWQIALRAQEPGYAP